MIASHSIPHQEHSAVSPARSRVVAYNDQSHARIAEPGVGDLDGQATVEHMPSPFEHLHHRCLGEVPAQGWKKESQRMLKRLLAENLAPFAAQMWRGIAHR